MGVDVVVQGASDEEHTAVERLFADWDETFSRFRPESELNRVNASELDTVLVSELFARVLRVGLGAARATSGLVDPTVGVAVEAAGYDRDFSVLTPDPRPTTSTMPGRWRTVKVSGVLISRPPGLRFDLNGVVKSLAVDEALDLVRGPGFVAAGGDIATRGDLVAVLPQGRLDPVAGRWPRDERDDLAALVARWLDATSPHRSAHGLTGRLPVGRGHSRRNELPRRGRRREGSVPVV